MKPGGLIFKFVAWIYRVDPEAMAEVDPDEGGHAPAGGFDEDFQEPRLEVPEGKAVAQPIRRELAPLKIPCQVEPEVWDALRMFDAGASPRTDTAITLHFDDLKRLGLLDDTGAPTLRHGDRLGAIYDQRGGLVQSIRNPPGLFVAEMRQESFGLSLRRPKRQILVLRMVDRQQAMGAST